MFSKKLFKNLANVKKSILEYLNDKFSESFINILEVFIYIILTVLVLYFIFVAFTEILLLLILTILIMIYRKIK